MLSPSEFLSPEELNDFATEFLGLNETDSDLFYETYFNMDTEMNYYEEEYARNEDWLNGRLTNLLFLCKMYMTLSNPHHN